MTDLRDILQRALPDAEPLRVTRESALAAGRKAARTRRRLAVVAAAAAAIVVVTLAAGLLPRASSEPTSTPIRVTPTTSAPSTVEPADPRVNRRPTESESRAVARLTAAVKAAVYPLLPPQTLHPEQYYTNTETGSHQPLRMYRRDTHTYSAYAEVSDPQDAVYLGYIEFTLHPYTGEDPDRPFAVYCDVLPPRTNVHCETRVGPHGERIMIRTHLDVVWPVYDYRVDLVKADGTMAVAIARMVGGDSKSRSTPPLTVDQMVAVLLSPDLTLYA